MDCQNSRTVQANNDALNPVTLHAYLNISQPCIKDAFPSHSSIFRKTTLTHTEHV